MPYTEEKSYKKIFFKNFLAGIAYGLGLTVGIALLTYLLGLFLSTIGGIPLVGNFLAKIVSATIYSINAK